MIVAFSTSSPFASVAILSPEGLLASAWQGDARRNASEACLRHMSENGLDLASVSGYIADIGPGSFTGVRVAVMLAKALGWAHGVRVAGIDSFDLIRPNDIVSLPGRRGEWLVREPGQNVRVEAEFSGYGYGTGAPRTDYPDASKVVEVFDKLHWLHAMELLPNYHLAPSISTPKAPYRPEVLP